MVTDKPSSRARGSYDCSYHAPLGSSNISSAASSPDLRPIIISGPSGVGKGTLIQMLIDSNPDQFSATVSHTTRKPRPGEKDGIAYHFVSPAIFSEMIATGRFIEHTLFSGNHYGTSKDTVARQKLQRSTALLDIDVEGVKTIVESGSLDTRCVFIKPPSPKTLEDRLRGRETETEESIQQRLARAKDELQYAETSEVYDIVITNDDLGKAYEELEAFAFGSHR
ncbi:unnamed protein product [Fusarium equiseti]|uniref:guanylate kinase n=1 Tax=Fusarium equiseti TaxID=61235 RepID=A0A8J2IM12_FUSEQ|nr:unnamed protein product [Fusarium equiseti]